MLNEKDFQEKIDRRLSGLGPSSQRRMRIRTAINAERQETKPMKRKLSVVWALALMLVLLGATLAIAETLNLFNFFGERDDRYAQVAQKAQLESPVPVTVAWDEWEDVNAVIDSAYFDGLTLSLAFQVEEGVHAEPWTPDEAQLAQMTKVEAMPIAIEAGHPDTDIYRAFNQAMEQGVPYGYRAYTVYPSDHAYAQDGTDIPPSAYESRYTEDGIYVELREFESPLPQHLADMDEIALSIRLYRAEKWVYFDGTACYRYDARSEAGALEATVTKTEGEVAHVQGAGVAQGMELQVEGQVSRMAAVLTITAEEDFAQFFQSVPENIGARDMWLEVVAVDEEGRRYRPQEDVPRDTKTARVALLGTGYVPKELTLYVYPCYEGMDTVALDQMAGIPLTVTFP